MILVHACCGRSASTWVEAIFLALCEELRSEAMPLRCEARGAQPYLARLEAHGFEDHTLHPAVILPWHELALERCPHPWRVFHVRRDPRDLLVSKYFAVEHSHEPNPFVDEARPVLRACSMEEGLAWLTTHRNFSRDMEIQQSFVGRGPSDGCLGVEFEELAARPVKQVRRLLAFAGLELGRKRLRHLVEARSFERMSGGRRRGEEDVAHHYRKGVAGDWKEHFTPAVTELFKERWGKLLVELGYERDLDW